MEGSAGILRTAALPLLRPPPNPRRLPPSPCRLPQVLKGAVGTTYILAAGMAFTGVLPFSVLTSVIVAYGMAGEMVKLAETNMLSE